VLERAIPAFVDVTAFNAYLPSTLAAAAHEGAGGNDVRTSLVHIVVAGACRRRHPSWRAAGWSHR